MDPLRKIHSHCQEIFLFFFVPYVSRPKNAGDFRFFVKKMISDRFLGEFRPLLKNEHRKIDYFRFSDCENENSVWNLRGPLRAHKVRLCANMSFTSCNACENEGKDFSRFCTVCNRKQQSNSVAGSILAWMSKFFSWFLSCFLWFLVVPTVSSRALFTCCEKIVYLASQVGPILFTLLNQP